jgi:hypothetical protein
VSYNSKIIPQKAIDLQLVIARIDLAFKYTAATLINKLSNLSYKTLTLNKSGSYDLSDRGISKHSIK